MFAPGTPANTTGTGAVYSESAPLNSDYAVTGTGTSKESAVPTETGLYTWETIYGGYSSPTAGALDEPPSVSFAYVNVAPPSPGIDVTPGPTVLLGTSQAMTASAGLGDAFNPSGTITFYLTDYYNAQIVYYSDTIVVSGNGTYSTATGTNPGGYVPTSTGSYSWKAVYSGDATNPPVSSTNYNYVEVDVGTNVALTSSASPSVLNQPVTLTATVTTTSGQAAPPAGEVYFEDAGTTLDGVVNATLNGTTYQVSITTSSLPVGTNPIQAVYIPNPLDYVAGSSSNVLEQQVNAVVLTAVPRTINATEGIAFTGEVATFADSALNDTPSASIIWDDGSTSVGTISGPDAYGVFTVVGSHTFAEEVSDAPVSVVVSDSRGLTATANSTANVSDASLSAAGLAIAATAGATFSGTVATFTDADPNGAIDDYSATIDWGDGATTAGTVTAAAGGGFAVAGSHAYNKAQVQAITVSIADVGGSAATANTRATIAAPLDYTSSGGNVNLSLSSGNVQIVANGNVVISAPLAEVSSVAITGADGVANNFTLDYSGGSFFVSGGMSFNGGALPATPSNALTIVGGNFDTDTYDFTNAHDGSIQLGTNGQVVHYSNLTPLVNTWTANNVVLDLPDGTVDATLDAGSSSGTIQLASDNGAFETTTLAAPSGSLTVNAGNGVDTVIATDGFYKNFAGNIRGSATVAGPGASLIGGVLYLVGGNTNDQVHVKPFGTSNTGSTGVQVDAHLDGIDIDHQMFVGPISRIIVAGFGGNDNVNFDPHLTVATVVSEGDDNDNVQLGDGNNTVTAGNGNDHVQAGDGNNLIVAGSGNDDVHLGDGNNLVTLGNGNDSVHAGDGDNAIVAGSGNNDIHVGNGDNLLAGGTGHDNVHAGNGNNILIDGSVALSQDALSQALSDWIADDVADVAAILAPAVTCNTKYANTLTAGKGLDWFWAVYPRDHINAKPHDLVN